MKNKMLFGPDYQSSQVTTAGHGAIPRGTMTCMNSALNDYIRRRGLLTPLEEQCRAASAERNRARRKRS